jgi:hypothetical protein
MYNPRHAWLSAMRRPQQDPRIDGTELVKLERLDRIRGCPIVLTIVSTSAGIK